jgi:anti-sigma factor RsiW
MDKFTCSALVTLVTEYLEGSLSPGENEQFEVHLKRCPPCDVYLVQIQQTIRACGRLDLGAIDARARAALMDAFQDWKAAR